MHTLPHESIVEILSYLPLGDIAIKEGVCRAFRLEDTDWRTLVLKKTSPEENCGWVDPERPLLESLAFESTDRCSWKKFWACVYRTGLEMSWLSRAASLGDIGVVDALLRAGADINAVVYGKAALHWAAKRGHRDVVKLLLDRGAIPHVEDSVGSTPMHLAAYNGHSGVVEELLKHDSMTEIKDAEGYTPLMLAAGMGKTDVVTVLLNHNAKLNEVDSEGWNALRLAIAGTHPDTVLVLLHHGADVNEIDDEGASPLNYAREYNCEDTIRILIEHGADVAYADGWKSRMYSII